MPALLGRKPVFSHKINIVKPQLPKPEELEEGLNEILLSGMVTKGSYLQKFEEAIASHLQVKHAIGVSSCTTGLMLVYKCLGLTGEVIVPSFTFMATVSSLIWCGLQPVYVDVNLETTNIAPNAIEQAITPRTSAIVAVHNFGNPAEIMALERIAKKHNLSLIFDAAHGFGTLYQHQPVGSQGRAQVFSLSPTKLLIAGEGGIVATNDDDLAVKIRMGREYGNDGSYDSVFAGMNARLAEFNALLGLHSLNYLESAAKNRNKVSYLYRDRLAKLPGIGFQEIHAENRSSYKDFSITINPDLFGLNRDELAIALTAENIDTRKYYDPPVHRQKAYRQFYSGNTLPNTESLSQNSISLPIWSDMSAEIAAGICDAIERAHHNAPEIRRFLA
jgi:dTDP-4-amino-4,6-dideoxygalactose transaminase